MSQVLKLDVNLAVFVAPKARNFVQINRKGREGRTVIYPVSLQQLKLFPLLPRIKEIMSSDDFQGKCEALSPLYVLVTNSKVDLVQRAVRENPFNSSYFIWMDGGYGHGETEEDRIFPQDGVWSPSHLLDFPDKVTFTALEELPGEDERPEDLHKIDKTWIAGGLYGGGGEALDIYHRLHHQVFMEYLERGIVDDDQTIFLESFLRNRTNFRPVRGPWYDLMKTLP